MNEITLGDFLQDEYAEKLLDERLTHKEHRLTDSYKDWRAAIDAARKGEGR